MIVLRTLSWKCVCSCQVIVIIVLHCSALISLRYCLNNFEANNCQHCMSTDNLIMGDKRSRSQNFTNEEKLACLNVIKKYKHIIENKETGTPSWKEKEKAWLLIENEFNATSNTYRSADVLKRFYNNKKKETRKLAALARSQFNKTGGGEPTKASDDPVFNLTMDIINKKTVFGLSNKFDDDAEMLHLNEAHPIAFAKDENEANILMNEGEEIVILQMEGENNYAVKDITEMNEICENDMPPRQLKTPIKEPQAQGTLPVNQKEWSNRRRPVINKTENLVLKYEEVASVKKELLELQLETLKMEKDNIEERQKWDQKDREVKEKRNAEEFQLRRTALQLDIEIKREQLQALRAVQLK